MGWWARLIRDENDEPKGRQESEQGGSLSNRGLSQREVEILDACCRARAPAVITWPDTAQVRRAWFRRLLADAVLFELQPQEGGRKSRPRSACTVSFHFNVHVAVFASSEGIVGEGHGPLHQPILLDLPSSIALEGRRFFRVPVLQSAELKIQISSNGRVLQGASIQDISVAGTQLHFPLKLDPLLALDDELEIGLGFSEFKCTMTGFVRRIIVNADDVRVGVVFQNAIHEHSDEPPEDLCRLVREIERFWLQNQVRRSV